MALSASELIAAFAGAFVVCLAALRAAGGPSAPLFLYAYVSLPLASMVAISQALEVGPSIRAVIIGGVIWFLASAYVLRRRSRSIPSLRETPLDRFDPRVLHFVNLGLAVLLLPRFLANLLHSTNPHADRIAAIQGMAFLFYPHFFLCLGIATLFLTKLVERERRGPLLSVSALVSVSSLLAFGGRVFPLLIVLGLLVMRRGDAAYPRMLKAVVVGLVALGFAYFAFIDRGEASLLERIAFRVTNSGDILYYLNDSASVRDIASTYPHSLADLVANPFRRLLGYSTAFATPGPFLFDGEGQGPLPSFIFDGMFYLGSFGYLYLAVFPIVFWSLIARALASSSRRSDGDRLFAYCLLLLPALHLMLDLATFNGFMYVLAVAFGLSRFVALLRTAHLRASDDSAVPET